MSSKPCKSVEGYIVFCSGINEEANEELVEDLFAEYGNVKGIQMNLERRTGKMKGYALIQYSELSEAQAAIKKLNESEFLNKKIKVDFAFKHSSKDNQ